MTLSEIRINPENHSKYDCDPGDGFLFDKCLDVHNDIDKYFTSVLGNGTYDWGGKYASFLNDIGIEHQSDNGWWSKAAVNSKNIEAFIKYYTESIDESSFILHYESARESYSKLKKAKLGTHNYHLASDAINALNSI